MKIEGFEVEKKILKHDFRTNSLKLHGEYLLDDAIFASIFESPPPTRKSRVGFCYNHFKAFNLHGEYLLDDAIFASIFS